MTLAAEMQSHLLPSTSPFTAKLGLAARTVPASAVGGDFYEFIRYNTKRISAGAIGDVTGKGIPAAIYGAMVTGIIRTLAHQELGAAEMLQELNGVLLRRPVQGRFVSLIYAIWDDWERRLQIANSGLPHPIHVHRGQIQLIEAEGLPLGVFQEAEYEEVSLSCVPGDMVVFFTDGITDAQNENDEEFGRSRLGPMVLFRLLGAAAFVSGVYAVSNKRAQWITALALAIPAGVLNTAFAFQPELQIAVPTLIFTILFLAFTLVSLLRAVVRAERVTHDTIYGGLSVYLLMAITWAAAYLLLVTVQPDAITLDAVRHPNHTMDRFDCVFYSFVTLTSLGYGDIVPMTAQARSLSVLEAVSGIMYVAVLIARLVGLHSATNSQVNSEAAASIPILKG